MYNYKVHYANVVIKNNMNCGISVIATFLNTHTLNIPFDPWFRL